MWGLLPWTISERLRRDEAFENGRRRRHLDSLSVGVFGFLLVILLGALLLMLPIANQNAQMLNFVDALFTSVTCVCVTGLVTVVPAAQFTLFGKIVLLVLIQIGGWGVIVCGAGILILLHRKISMNARALLSDYLGMDTLTGIVRMLLYVVKGSLAVEGIGALGYALVFVPRFGLARGVWYAVFHAVSAFCNAGVDILGDSSLKAYGGNVWINLVTMALIIVGGLGFIVWLDLQRCFQKVYHAEGRKESGGEREQEMDDTSQAGSLLRSAKQETVRRQLEQKYRQLYGIPLRRSRRKQRRLLRERAMRELKTQTKIVLFMTAALVVSGAVLILAGEHNNPMTMGDFPLWKKVLASLFQSVTARTAGFATFSQAGMRDATKFICCILMFIGGSPVGTAGGIKTVTYAVILFTCWSILKGHEDTECFGRKIQPSTVRTAYAVMMLGLLMVVVGTVLLSLFEPGQTLIDLLYEVISAAATVGLTADVTPALGTASKLVLIILMYLGRVGAITVPMMIARTIGKRNDKRTLPEDHVVVG